MMSENMFDEGFQTGAVNVGRSAVRSINASTAHLEQTAVQRLTAETVNANASAFGVTNAATAELNGSTAGVVAGDYVKIEDSRVLILLAPRVSGNVKAVLTLPAAFALGAGYYFARRLMIGLAGRSNR
jgi:hypothetical protein